MFLSPGLVAEFQKHIRSKLFPPRFLHDTDVVSDFQRQICCNASYLLIVTKSFLPIPKVFYLA